MNINKIVDTFAKQSKKATFVSIKGYKTNKGETKDYIINFNSPYKTAVEKSVIQLFKFNPTTEEEKVAKEEILTSLKKSIDSCEDNSLNSQVSIPGLKQTADGKIFITGFVVKQKPDDSTDVKKKIFASLPVSNFRQFEISPSKMNSIVINGKKIKVS